MTDRETADTIDDAAANWASKLDRGLSEAEQDALDAWLSADVRRIGALARARAIWSHAEMGLVQHEVPVAPAMPWQDDGHGVLTRRRMIAGGIAAACASVALVPLLRRGSTLSSGVGEVRKIGLEDGSTVTLGTDTRLRYAFDASRRLITVLGGEAFFDIANDPVRPFVVMAGRLTLRAASAAFGVRMLDPLPLAVIVEQGRLRIEGLATRVPMILEANTQLSLPPSGGATRLVRLEPEALTRTLAWRDGMLAFEGETLADATAQFGRYAPIRFEISDPTLARATITGMFAANDPRGFARAVAPSLNARAEIGEDLIRLTPAGPAK
jgi:transmembrane sensor